MEVVSRKKSAREEIKTLFFMNETIIAETQFSNNINSITKCARMRKRNIIFFHIPAKIYIKEEEERPKQWIFFITLKEVYENDSSGTHSSSRFNQYPER